MSLSRKLCFWLLSIIYMPIALAAGLQARVNTATVVEGDAFQLVLSTNSDVAAPDVSPLEKDFQVLGTSQSTQFKFMNGKQSVVKSWVLTLVPKKIGRLTIPVITAGNVSSQVIHVNVVDSRKAPATQGAGQDVNITVRLNGQGDKFYQFQEIPLTVRIEVATPTHNLTLLAPSSKQVELVQTAQDRHSQIIKNGQRIDIIERDYTLRPQQLGRISLPPFTLKGHVPDPNYRDPIDDFNRHFDLFFSGSGAFGQSPFSQMRGGQPFAKRSNTLDFTVSANPNAQSGEWFLPAKAVELDAQWLPENPTFKQGEAVTRIVRLQALGARAEQLPELDFGSIDGAKVYVDDNQTAMRKTTEGTQALREVRLSIVPSREGEIILPEISVKWLNTETDETTTTVLPREVIQVQGSHQNSQHQAIQKNAQQQAKTTPTLNVGGDREIPADTKQADKQQNGQAVPVSETMWWHHWWLWVLGIVASLCIAAVVRFIAIAKQRGVKVAAQLPFSTASADNQQYKALRKNVAHSSQQQKKQQSEYMLSIRQNVRQACENGDVKALYQALLQWQQAQSAAKQSTVINSLKKQLESVLFSQNADGEVVNIDFAQIQIRMSREWKALSKRPDEKNDGLPALYSNNS